MPGTVIFKPIEANITHNTEFIGKMDPYCLFHVGNQKIKSQVSRKGGKHPQWEDSVVVPITSQSICHIEVKDKDLFHDDKIGGFEVDLREVEAQGRVRKWYPFFYKEKPAGEILMEAIYAGDSTASVNRGLVPSSGAILNKTPVPTIVTTTTTTIQPQQSNIVVNQTPLASTILSTPYVANQGIIGTEIPTGTIYGSQAIPITQSVNLLQPVNGAYPSNYSSIPGSGYGNGDSFAMEALIKGVDPHNAAYAGRYNQVPNIGGGLGSSGYVPSPQLRSADPGIISMTQNVIPANTTINQQIRPSF